MREDVGYFRDLGSREPWSVTKQRAIDGTETLDTIGDMGGRFLDFRDELSAHTLAYLLDEDNRDHYTDHLEQLLDFGLEEMANAADTGHAGTVYTANIGLEAVLAMDAAHEDLDSDKLSRWEVQIQEIINEANPYLWEPARDTLKLAFGKYRDEQFDWIAEDVYDALMSGISGDGVYNAGTGYASARYNYTDRQVKNIAIDLLVHEGGDYADLYDENRLGNFYEWLYGYAVDPSGHQVPFGDSAPSDSLRGSGDPSMVTGYYRAGRFSKKAARYAAFQIENHAGDKAAEAPSGLTGYVLVDENWKDVEPELAPSRIFPDGGAFFLEDSNTTDALYGALWNISSSEGHSHKEVNALAISGFGEALLVNAGYNGWGRGFDRFSWNDMNSNARQANTLLIDNENHGRKTGGRIVRGFTGPGLDYAVDTLDSGAGWVIVTVDSVDGVGSRALSFLTDD